MPILLYTEKQQKVIVLQCEHSKHGQAINKHKMFDVKTSSKCSYIGHAYAHGEFKKKSKKQPRGKSGYSLCFPGHGSLSRLHQRKLCKETQPGNPTGQNQKLIELVNTKGKTMKVLGTTKITIQAPGGGWTTTVALVCPQLSH